MHDTQIRKLNNYELCASYEEFMGINSLNISSEIDFDSIKIESEYLQSKNKTNSIDFIGDMEESTEIDSIISPLNMTVTSSKLSTGEENTETEEILNILKQKSPKSNTLRMSNPELYTPRRVLLTGRVLHCESGVPVTECSTPFPIRPRCVPRRVSNPFQQNFDSLTCNNNLITSKVYENISRVDQF
jgi:hypothetical protein